MTRHSFKVILKVKVSKNAKFNIFCYLFQNYQNATDVMIIKIAQIVLDYTLFYGPR